MPAHILTVRKGPVNQREEPRACPCNMDNLQEPDWNVAIGAVSLSGSPSWSFGEVEESKGLGELYGVPCGQSSWDKGSTPRVGLSPALMEYQTYCKYFVIALDNKLKWDSWTDFLHTLTKQSMYFLEKLHCLFLMPTNWMFQMFYTTFIESVLTFCIIYWFGSAREVQKKSVRETVTTANKLLGFVLPSIQRRGDTVEKGK